MTPVRPLRVAFLATLLVACPLVAAPPAADAGGKSTSSGVRKILPRVACSVVAFPDRGAPVSAGQAVKVPGQSAKFWMKVRLENQGLTPQTASLQLLFWDGTRQAINQTISNVRVTPDQPFESGVWFADLGAGAHKVRAAGVILGLKDNAASNECVVEFTVVVGSVPLAGGTAQARIIPDLTCDVRVEWVHPSGARASVSTGQALQIPEHRPNFRAYIRVANGLVFPYGSAVKVHLVVDANQARIADKEFTIPGPITTGGDGAYSQFVDLSLPDGASQVIARGSILGVPTNRNKNASGGTDCAAVAFTASVAAPPPGAPPIPVFTQRLYPILTRSECTTCHFTNERPGHPGGLGRNCVGCHRTTTYQNPLNLDARPELIFARLLATGLTIRPAAELCASIQGPTVGRARIVVTPVNPHPGGYPAELASAIALWRDTPPQPAYKCP